MSRGRPHGCLEIREGGPEAAAAICELTATVWRTAYVDLLGSETVEEHLAETNDPEQMRNVFDEYALTAFLAGDPLVGAATCRPDGDGDQFYLTTLYVHPDHWREGIGSALLDRVEAEAREQGCTTVVLVVIDENDRARTFYEAHGYEERGVRDERIDERVDELRYEKELRV